MSAFTESALLKKLGELNSSQQSIQTLSLWLIHHRKHHSAIVRTWLREFQTAPEPKKLTFMYLANDVIQNSKKKGPEYGKEFAHVLPRVFSHIGETCTAEKLFGSLGRILNIWEERGVYDPKAIKEYRARLNKEHKKDGKDANDGGTPEGTPPGLPASNSSNSKSNSEKKEKRKHDESKIKSKRHRSAGQGDDEEPSASSNGTANDSSHGISLSPHVPIGEPPEPEELIKALTNIENSASSDAVVRERIANLPPEISEIGCLSKLEDKEAAKTLAKQVNEAVQLLNEYNARLAAEMEDRTKLATMLRDFQAEQKELLIQAEQRLEEYKKKLTTMIAVQKEIKDHLSNLPDLTQLPDVTGGLAPLPSAGDLFSIH